MNSWNVIRGWFGYNERNIKTSESRLSSATLPKSFATSQNYPNPFNPSTTIRLEIPEDKGDRPVNVSVYDLRGRLVAKLVDEKKAPGTYQIHWDGKDAKGQRVSSGVYLYRIVAGDFTSTRKMLMVQ